MDLTIKRTQKQKIIYFLCATFLLYLTVSSLTEATRGAYYNNFGSQIPGKDLSGERVAYLLKDFSDLELINAGEYRLLMNRSVRDDGQIFIRILQVFLPAIGYGVFAYFVRHIIQKPERPICVLAMKKGGHAPPEQF